MGTSVFSHQARATSVRQRADPFGAAGDGPFVWFLDGIERWGRVSTRARSCRRRMGVPDVVRVAPSFRRWRFLSCCRHVGNTRHRIRSRTRRQQATPSERRDR